MIPLGRRTLVAIFAGFGLLSSSLAAQNPAAPAGASSSPAADPPPAIVVGAGLGGGLVGLLNSADGSTIATAPVFGAFTGGVRVASGDVDGDGIADLIVAPGPGTPAKLLHVFSGADGHEIASGYPYGPAYTAGVHVAAGDLNGDGRADVFTSPDVGGMVRAFNIGVGGAPSAVMAEGFPYGVAFMGGVRVAAGDLNGDGRALHSPRWPTSTTGADRVRSTVRATTSISTPVPTRAPSCPKPVKPCGARARRSIPWLG